jgi:hypothetical protein
MDPADRYVTQSSAYDRLLFGPVLTDRRITALKKKGYYSSGLVLPAEGRVARKSRQRLSVDQLLQRYNI